MQDAQLAQLERKVVQLRKIELVVGALYEELCGEGHTDEAEAIFVALVRVRAALAAEEERLMRLDSHSYLCCNQSISMLRKVGALRLPTGEKETINERQATDGSARMSVANELLHVLRRGADAGSPLHPSLEPSLGPRGRVGMCVAGMPTPVGSWGRYLHISRRNRHGEDGAAIP